MLLVRGKSRAQAHDENFETKNFAEYFKDQSRMKVNNLPGEEAAAEFYTHSAMTRVSQVIESEDETIDENTVGAALGQWIPKNSSRYFAKTTDLDVRRIIPTQFVLAKKKRPLEDKNILTLNSKAPKAALLHEIGHLLFDRGQAKPFFQTPDGIMNGQEIEAHEAANWQSRYISAIRADMEKQGDKAQELEYDDAFLDTGDWALKRRRHETGAEMDVTQLLIDLAADLELPEADKKYQSDYFDENYEALEKQTVSGFQHPKVRQMKQTWGLQADSTRTLIRKFDETLFETAQSLDRTARWHLQGKK